MTLSPISVQALRSRDRCQRLFSLQYRDRIYWPGVVREPSADMRLGEAFHRLVVRHRLGLEVQPQAALADVWTRFLESPYGSPHGRSLGGDLQVGDLQVFSEQVLQFSLEGVPFLVRCDEIRRQGDQWTILDWKTGRVREDELADHWQTRLYRFALALSGTAIGAAEPIPAQNIKMVFLLVRTEKVLAFQYDQPAFEADRALFTTIARQVAAPPGTPAGPADPQICQSCRFDSFCNARPAPPVTNPAPSLPRFV